MTVQNLIDNQILIQTIMMIGALLLLGAVETKYRWRRLIRHASLFGVSQLCIKLVFPLLTVGVAAVIQSKHMGLLNEAHFPAVVSFILGILAMDLTMYWQHRMLHKYRWLWRFHQVHHMDTEVDITTALRFHPFEMLFSTAVKIVAISFFGINVVTVIVFEILLSMALLFAHLNVSFSPKVDNWLRYCFVTPQMHRIHHSDFPGEMNSNYGFCFSIWDKLLNSYIFSHRTGDANLVVGLEGYRAPLFQTFESMLWVPFNIKSLRLRPKKDRLLEFEKIEKNKLYEIKKEPSDKLSKDSVK